MAGHHHNTPESDAALRVKAIEQLLTEKGLVDPAALDVMVDLYENRIGPRNGASVVARAWSDEAYKARPPVAATPAIPHSGHARPPDRPHDPCDAGKIRKPDLPHPAAPAGSPGRFRRRPGPAQR